MNWVNRIVPGSGQDFSHGYLATTCYVIHLASSPLSTEDFSTAVYFSLKMRGALPSVLAYP